MLAMPLVFRLQMENRSTSRLITGQHSTGPCRNRSVRSWKFVIALLREFLNNYFGEHRRGRLQGEVESRMRNEGRMLEGLSRAKTGNHPSTVHTGTEIIIHFGGIEC